MVHRLAPCASRYTLALARSTLAHPRSPHLVHPALAFARSFAKAGKLHLSKMTSKIGKEIWGQDDGGGGGGGGGGSGGGGGLDQYAAAYGGGGVAVGFGGGVGGDDAGDNSDSESDDLQQEEVVWSGVATG